MPFQIIEPAHAGRLYHALHARISRVSTAAALLCLGGINVIAASLIGQIDISFFGFPVSHAVSLTITAMLLLAGNGLLIGFMALIRHSIIQPWRRISHLIRHSSAMIAEERGELSLSLLNLRDMAGELARFANNADEAYRKYLATRRELDDSRRLLAQVMLQQQTIIASTNREIIEQYRSVLAYANYLDEHVQRQRGENQLRYDFDDVCESGFNLKLVSQSLELMRRNAPEMVDIPLCSILQQTLVALAPALERRSMKLSTLGVDDSVLARTDVTMLAHALWMMLLGTIRYAAAESTLRLRCLPSDDGETAIISIVISELEPGQLTAEERYAHLQRQINDVTPHMFAETIRLHGNVQLAELLLGMVEGMVTLTPISSYACELSLLLPAAKKACEDPQGL